MHEGIPILNYLVPKAFMHEDGKLTGMIFEKVRRRARRRRAGASSCRPASPTQLFACDDVLVAVGQENAFPWIERDIGLEFDSGACRWSTRSRSSRRRPDVFFGGDAAFGPKNIIWAVAHGHEAAISIDKLLPRRGRRASGPPPRVNLVVAEDGHPRVELRQRHLARERATRCRWRTSSDRAARTSRSRSSSASTAQLAYDGGAALPELRRADGVHAASSASNATPASTSARWTASPSPRTATRRTCARGCTRRRRNLDQELYVSGHAQDRRASW